MLLLLIWFDAFPLWNYILCEDSFILNCLSPATESNPSCYRNLHSTEWSKVSVKEESSSLNNLMLWGNRINGVCRSNCNLCLVSILNFLQILVRHVMSHKEDCPSWWASMVVHQANPLPCSAVHILATPFQIELFAYGLEKPTTQAWRVSRPWES